MKGEGISEEVIKKFTFKLDGTVIYGDEELRIGVGAWNKGLQNPFLLPCHNNLFNSYLAKIETEICSLLFEFPDKKEYSDILGWITMNWRRTFEEAWDKVKG